MKQICVNMQNKRPILRSLASGKLATQYGGTNSQVKVPVFYSGLASPPEYCS